MDFFAAILEYRFLQHALAAAVLTGVSCGVVGSWVVARRAVFVSGGITHASFGGIGLAWFLGWNPILGAALFALAVAMGIEWAGQRMKIREDSAIGMVWSVGMALGIIFIALTPGYAPNLVAILFGNILTATGGDLMAAGVLAVVTTAVFGLWTRPLTYVAFDADWARSQGVPVRIVSYAMAALVALVIVFSIRAVGIVLLISLLTFPAVIINSLTGSFPRIVVWSAVVAVAAGVVGLWAGWRWNIPTGAATISALTLALIAVKVGVKIRNTRNAKTRQRTTAR
ncbi:MAG: metal ABC transporter permease [Alistipes sp.]|jgi:zinc transport system permease protein|nr:metal ABC transporter permease [Alistipes sp.]